MGDHFSTLLVNSLTQGVQMVLSAPDGDTALRTTFLIATEHLLVISTLIPSIFVNQCPPFGMYNHACTSPLFVH
jgi:hypothetical protein